MLQKSVLEDIRSDSKKNRDKKYLQQISNMI